MRMVQTKRLLALILLVIPGVAWAVSGPADGDFAGAVAVDGRNIHLECKGTGAPTVILISGYRNDARDLDHPAGSRPNAGVRGGRRIHPRLRL